MSPLQDTIASLMIYLYDNREKLSATKFSGMHKVDNVYRIHKSSFIPLVLNNGIADADVDRSIAAVADIYFHNKGLVWDANSYWITIS